MSPSLDFPVCLNSNLLTLEFVLIISVECSFRNEQETGIPYVDIL